MTVYEDFMASLSGPLSTASGLSDAKAKIVQEQITANRLGGSDALLSQRKREAAKRVRILNENFHSDVADLICKFFRSPAIRQRVIQHITVSVNLGLDVVTAENVVYKQGVRRSVKAGKSKLAAFLDLYEQANMDSLGPALNRLSAFVGPVLEIPQVAHGEHRKHIFTADCFDVVQDPGDPLGQPIAAAYTDPVRQEVVLIDDLQVSRFAIDSGDPVSSEAHGIVNPVTGEPDTPFTVWQGDQPWSAADWWQATRESGLVEASLQIAYLVSVLDWMRKSQNREIPYLFAPLEDFPKNQVADSEEPILADTSRATLPPTFGSLSLDTSPENFIAHIMFLIRSQIGRRGIIQTQFDYTGEVIPAHSLAMQHERLSQRRNAQKQFIRRAEHMSAWKAVAHAAANGHRDAAKLPDPETVYRTFNLEIPELSRMEDPAQMRDHVDWEIGKGLTNPVRLIMARNPGLSEDEAFAEGERNLEATARFNEIRSSRKVPADANLAKSEDVVNGERGPQVRDFRGPEGPGVSDDRERDTDPTDPAI